MTDATISNWQFQIEDIASPPVLQSVEEVISVSGLGKSNELVEATNFDSPQGTREFIAGLSDGAEFTVEANYIPGATVQPLVMDAVDSGATRPAVLSYTGVSPNKTFSFSAVCLGYEVAPDNQGVNQISFTFKVSGDITRA